MKVKVTQAASNLWYADEIGTCFAVYDTAEYDGRYYRLVGEHGHGARLLFVNDVVQVVDAATEHLAHNKYMREVKPGVFCDVYDLLRAFEVRDPCLQHLIKKALAAGKRGHKDALTDYKDIVASALRALELHEEWVKE